MTYEQLLPIYQQTTGRAGQDADFNTWVQGLIDQSGSQTGIDGIPDGFVQAPTNTGGTSYNGGNSATGTGFTGLLTPNVTSSVPQASVNAIAGSNYNQVQNANQSGAFGTVGSTDQQTGQNQTTSNNTSQNQTSQQDTNQATKTNQDVTGTQTNNQNTTGTQTNNQANNQTSVNNQNTSQNQSTTGQQLTSGTSNQTNTGQESDLTKGAQSTVGTSDNKGTTNVIDSLGFGKLLQDQAGSTSTNDAARAAFLKDTMNTGGSQFNSQVDQAVHNSLSGPGMSGAGQSASARAAGYAGAQVARGNLDQRLSAAQQLAGPTGLTTLAAAGNPYLGQATDNTGKVSSDVTSLSDSTKNTLSSLLGSNTQGTTSSQNQNTTGNTSGSNSTVGNTSGTSTNQSNTNGTNTTNQNTSGTQDTTGSTTGSQSNTGSATGTQDTTGFSKLAEASTGTTAAGSSQAASGIVPQGQAVKSGGCVICTAGLELGLFRTPRALRKAALHKLDVETKRFSGSLGGYFKLFTPLARWMLRHPKLAAIGMPIAKAVVYEELRIAGQKLPFRVGPWCYHWTWHLGCAIGGAFCGVDHVTDPVILGVAKKHNVCFTIKGVK